MTERRGINLSGVRDHNAALILSSLRSAGSEGVPQARLAEMAELTPQAIPPTILRLSTLARWVVGAYLDRERTTFALIGLSGTEVSRMTVPVGMNAPSAEVFNMFEEQLPALLGRAPAKLSLDPSDGMLGVGVACPGPLDQESGILSGVTTGLGAGLILSGGVYHARHVRAGEFGHQTVDIDGPPCDCGRHGCLEAVCMQALSQGRPDLAADHLAVGLVNLDRLLGIDQVTLGGSTIEEFPEIFRDRVHDALAKTTGPEEPPEVRVVLADQQLVAHGAAARVLDAFFQPAN